MTNAAENQFLTQIDAGTPMGDLLRCYWLPAALSSEFVADGDPVRLMLLGEKLIGFRDSAGRVGVMDHRCPHRCASLFFGRNEAGGIRCVYHGWKFDTQGNCLEMANVPPHQDFRHKVTAKAYATTERNGIVWVFMGDQADVPPLPDIEATLLPEGERAVAMIQRECNWVQALEGDLDTSHVGFLHSRLAPDPDIPKDDPRHWGQVHRDPEYVIADTDYGLMYGARRPAAPGQIYWRIAHWLYPFWAITPAGRFERQIVARAWVPMDATHTMSIAIRNFDDPIVKRASASFDDYLPNTTDWLGRWRPVRNKANDYLIDRDAQRSETYSGIRHLFIQDGAVTESMGGIVDRGFEHLAPSDAMITRMIRGLLRSARDLRRDGIRPPGADRPDAYRAARGGYFLAEAERDWQEVYRDLLGRVTLSAFGAEAAE